ncbi:hypothetical protein BCR36DRAFT_584408 [Piromyces finnis]|uniref:Transmembrane protein n=1 Tax=Piromyces finnis TaxID=1754191 RepID=A0A1Y1V6X8_9FUNG|nr:hypothetical protein BCR36DRAFT_584408 [Piromyces finnis]|eukprot:ORX48095.1 hypothetical protein BCR36DRAFT_584408 [Piromyces finnis]
MEADKPNNNVNSGNPNTQNNNNMGNNETPPQSNNNPMGNNEIPPQSNNNPMGNNETPPQNNNNPMGNNETPPQSNNNPMGNNSTMANNHENNFNNMNGVNNSAIAGAPAENDKAPSSSSYPIICTVCAFAFIIGIYIYIIMSKKNKNPSKSSKKEFNKSNDLFAFNPNMGNQVNNSHPLFSHNNNSKVYGGGLSDSEVTSPFSDTNNLINFNRAQIQQPINFMNKDYGEPPVYHQNKEHYPNPLYNHSKPTQPNKSTFTPKPTPVVTPSISPVSSNSMNMGISSPKKYNRENDVEGDKTILTQEEIQLLKMRKNSMRNAKNNDRMEYSSRYNNEKSIPTIGGGMQNRNERFNTPNIDEVAPFNNFLSNNTQIKKPENIFVRDSVTDDSFNDNSFIRKLGNNIKIETKKFEYEEETIEEPINKLKIKRFNN